MITVKTSSGFEGEVNEKAFYDFRVMAAYSKMIDRHKKAEDKLAGATDLVDLLLREQQQDLYDCLEDNEHFVDPEKVFAEMGEIMEQIKDAAPETKK